MSPRIILVWLDQHRRATWWLGIGSGCLTAVLAFAFFTGCGDSSGMNVSLGLTLLASFVTTGMFLTLADETPRARDDYRW